MCGEKAVYKNNSRQEYWHKWIAGKHSSSQTSSYVEKYKYVVRELSKTKSYQKNGTNCKQSPTAQTRSD